jgi:hypothetical protein
MGTYRNIIVIQKDGKEEHWSNLKLLCDNHPEFSYGYIKPWKFPFEYKGWSFRKFEVNSLTPPTSKVSDDSEVVLKEDLINEQNRYLELEKRYQEEIEKRSKAEGEVEKLEKKLVELVSIGGGPSNPHGEGTGNIGISRFAIEVYIVYNKLKKNNEINSFVTYAGWILDKISFKQNSSDSRYLFYGLIEHEKQDGSIVLYKLTELGHAVRKYIVAQDF